jgi:hypothetical protein
MSGSLRLIDAAVSSRHPMAQGRSDYAPRQSRSQEAQDGCGNTLALRTTASLSLPWGDKVSLPRCGYALTVYQMNMDAERTLSSGPLFVDTYA